MKGNILPKSKTKRQSLHDDNLPIPDKLYFNISEVSDLCSIKAYVLRYWEQEFSNLRPMKGRGNRRFYQHQDILLIRQIKKLLYEEGFTIEGARQKLCHTYRQTIKEEKNDGNVSK